MPKNLVLVRHGESEGNFANHLSRGGLYKIPPEFAGRHASNWRLTNLGRQQATATGDWLREHLPLQYRRFYVSTYDRAKETAALLRLPGAQWSLDTHLRERDMGKLSMLPPDRVLRYPEELEERAQDSFHWRPPSGESFSDICIRLNLVVDRLSRKCDNQDAIIVCHGEVMWAFRFLLERIPPAEFRMLNKEGHIENCQVIHYTRTDPESDEMRNESTLRWRRMICPWDRARVSEDWSYIPKKRFSNAELLEMVDQHPPILFP